MTHPRNTVDENTKWLVVATLVAALIGGLIGSLALGYYTDKNFQTQIKNEQKNIAIGLLFEISQIEPDNTRIANSYIDYVNNRAPQPSPYYLLPIYPDTGLYYLYGKDIFKFDSELSELLYKYYYNELQIERERKYLVENYYQKDNSNISASDKKMFDDACQDFFSRTITIKELTPKITEKLQKYT